MLYVLRTVIFSLEGAIKRSTANVRMPRWRRKSAERQKREYDAFDAVSSSSPYGYLCPKLKTLKSKHRSHQFRTQRTKHLYQNNPISHIGFRTDHTRIIDIYDTHTPMEALLHWQNKLFCFRTITHRLPRDNQRQAQLKSTGGIRV